MDLTKETEKKTGKTEMKEEAKKMIGESEIFLNEEELDQVAGGVSPGHLNEERNGYLV